MLEVVEFRNSQLTDVKVTAGLASPINTDTNAPAKPDFALFCSLIRGGGSEAWVRTVMQIDQKQFDCFAESAGLRSSHYRPY